MPDRIALADEIERQLTLRDCPEHHTADLYLTPGKWRLVIAALRSKDREDGAREMRETGLHPRLADALAELGRHETANRGAVYWWRRASMEKLAALGLVETWLPKSMAHYKGKTLPYRLTEAGRLALAEQENGR